MKSVTCSFLIITLFIMPGILLSQDSIQALDQAYGLDQTLYNGKKYSYLPPPLSKGHQFLLSPGYFNGSVTIQGKCYENISLNYDIFNQQLLHQYLDDKGIKIIIEISKAWLNGFTLGKMNFELISINKDQRFFQVLGEGRVRIFYFWRKNLNLNDAIGSSNFLFSNAIRDTYVFTDGQLKPFKTKRNLIRLFDPGHRQEIKSYLRKNRIKVNKASDQVMADLITFIGNLK